MSVSCFGSAAAKAWAANLSPELCATVSDPSGFASAFTHLIELGMNGRSRDLVVLPVNPRAAVIDTAFAALQQQCASPDALLRGLDAIAQAQLTINNETQLQFEQRLVQPELAAVFQDAALASDRTFFRSFHELERMVAQYGYRPPRAHVFTPIPSYVPVASGPNPDVRGRGICVWAVGVSPAALAAFRASIFDLRCEVTIVTAAGGSEDALRRSQVIVALCDDPGTIYALARFAKPVCGPVCGAGEIVENLYEFQLWNRISIVDAILQALRGEPSLAVPLNGRDALPADRRIAVDTNGPLVSIVMPTYSRPNTLREGLKRLQEQTYANIEIVVVNNAGTPVDDVVAQFPNARLINRTENTGNATRPRNDGIEDARGKYVTLLDDDDVLFPDHVARMVHTLDRSGADAAYSDFVVRFVDRQSDGREIVWGWDLQKPFGITSYEMLVANRLGYFTVFMRRSLIDRIGLFAEEVLGGEEVEYWLRIARDVDFVHVAQPSSAYTVVRDWRGQLSEKSHALYAGGYEMVYERYPAADLPIVQQQRAAYVASLRSTVAPPPMQPRYTMSAQ